MSKPALVSLLTSDKALGAVGGCLAAGSLCFGVYMNVHGPVAGFGSSHDFTVFAQLAPKRDRAPQTHAEPDTRQSEDLDMTSTASIPQSAPAQPSQPEVSPAPDDELEANAQVIPAFTLEAANSDSATISIEGRTRMVRIGDTIPGAGEILAIRPGRRALVKTSRGVIVAARQD